MSSGERPIGAAKGKQPDAEALCHPPPPPMPCWHATHDSRTHLFQCVHWMQRNQPEQCNWQVCEVHNFKQWNLRTSGKCPKAKRGSFLMATACAPDFHLFCRKKLSGNNRATTPQDGIVQRLSAGELCWCNFLFVQTHTRMRTHPPTPAFLLPHAAACFTVRACPSLLVTPVSCQCVPKQLLCPNSMWHCFHHFQCLCRCFDKEPGFTIRSNVEHIRCILLHVRCMFVPLPLHLVRLRLQFPTLQSPVVVERVSERPRTVGGGGTPPRTPLPPRLPFQPKKPDSQNFALVPSAPRGFKLENSIAFGKSTSQRIYPKQHTPKIG